jgi:hypothetical protein
MAHVVDETITTTTSTTITAGGNSYTTTAGPTNNNATAYYAPKVGLVEYVPGPVGKVELVNLGHGAENTQGNHRLLRVEVKGETTPR